VGALPCSSVDFSTTVAGPALANAGVQPVTKKRVLEADLVDEVLSAMTMAGM
jgi:glutaminase